MIGILFFLNIKDQHHW